MTENKNKFNVRYNENGDLEVYQIFSKEDHENLKKICKNVQRVVDCGAVKEVQKFIYRNELELYSALYDFFGFGGDK